MCNICSDVCCPNLKAYNVCLDVCRLSTKSNNSSSNSKKLSALPNSSSAHHLVPAHHSSTSSPFAQLVPAVTAANRTATSSGHLQPASATSSSSETTSRLATSRQSPAAAAVGSSAAFARQPGAYHGLPAHVSGVNALNPRVGHRYSMHNVERKCKIISGDFHF